MIDTRSPESNPFATRHTRPGAIPYFFPAGDSPGSLVDRLLEQGGWGEIVGPHGSGKSTLLAALVPLIQEQGRQVAMITLRDGQRSLPAGALAGTDGQSVLVIVDGYEQLWRVNRWRLRRQCRRRGWGLLVTAHAPVGFPTLYRTQPDETTAVQIVQHLLGARKDRIEMEDIRSAYRRSGGNLREMLFALYDLHESRRPF